MRHSIDAGNFEDAKIVVDILEHVKDQDNRISRLEAITENEETHHQDELRRLRIHYEEQSVLLIDRSVWETAEKVVPNLGKQVIMSLKTLDDGRTQSSRKIDAIKFVRKITPASSLLNAKLFVEVLWSDKDMDWPTD
jgi:hypothetical protein